VNPNTTWEMVQAYPDKPWDWGLLSRNPNITWEIVQNNPDKPWNQWGLFENPNMTWEIVQANPDTFQQRQWFSWNPNITWEVIQSNLNVHWDWHGLSANPFTLEKQRFIRDYAARTIQNWWLELRLNPYHPVGRRKLERDYEFYMSRESRN